MKQVRITLTCDAHQAWKGREVSEGVETVRLGAQTLDLCPSHQEQVRPWLALIAEWGADPASNGASVTRRGGERSRRRRDNAERRAGERLTCPLCQQSSASTDSISQHLRNTHGGQTLTTVYGNTCPLCGEECSPGTMGQHALHAHQVHGGAPWVFAEAERQNDPHGVIASRVKALAAAAGG